jgi:CBS domain containing-hemolysin-like protein
VSNAALVVSALLLALAAWIRAAGSAVSRVPRADALRDAADGVAGAGKVASLLDERETISPAIGVVVSGLLVAVAVVATVAIVDELEFGAALGTALLVGAVIFVFGDPLPRSLGRWNSHAIAYRSSFVLTLATALGGWANELLTEEEEEDTPEETQELEDVEEQERELIDSVLEFSETLVREVMTPRPDMVTISVDDTIDELIAVATGEGYSRIPVTANGDVVGIVVVKDLLAGLSDEDLRPKSVSEVMRAVEFVPENKYASTLLSEMRDRHLHQVMVADEYGDIVGLVTIEDLIEELVGEISDETDMVENLIVPRGGGWVVDARLPVDELEKIIGVELPNEEWDTVGGLVLGLAERLPEVGERFRFESLIFTVTRMQGRRVSTVDVAVDDQVGAA